MTLFLCRYQWINSNYRAEKAWNCPFFLLAIVNLIDIQELLTYQPPAPSTAHKAPVG